MTSTRARERMTAEADAMLFMPISCAAGKESLKKRFSACSESGGAASCIQFEKFGVTVT